MYFDEVEFMQNTHSPKLLLLKLNRQKGNLHDNCTSDNTTLEMAMQPWGNFNGEPKLENSMPITLSLPYAQDPALQRPCYV